METIIKPKKGLQSVDLKELWNYRGLFYFLVWRDIKVRYKQTIFGVGWAIVQPLAMMVVFSVIFGGMAKIPSDNVPYPVFVYTGLLLWNLFSASLGGVSQSLVGNAVIIQKVYVPKLIISAAAGMVYVVDFFFSFLVFVGILAYYRFIPHVAGILVLPLVLLVTVLASLGLGLFLAALNVRYRDVRYILPFFMQLFIFVTPVIYPISIVSQKYRWLLGLNPMTGAISTFKAAFLGNTMVDWNGFLVSLVISMVLLCFGLWYFLKTEKVFADII